MQMCSPEAKCNTLYECRKNNYLSLQSAAVHLLGCFVRCLGFGKNIRSRASWRQSMSTSKQKRHECVCAETILEWTFIQHGFSCWINLLVFFVCLFFSVVWTTYLSRRYFSVILSHQWFIYMIYIRDINHVIYIYAFSTNSIAMSGNYSATKRSCSTNQLVKLTI